MSGVVPNPLRGSALLRFLRAPGGPLRKKSTLSARSRLSFRLMGLGVLFNLQVNGSGSPISTGLLGADADWVRRGARPRRGSRAVHLYGGTPLRFRCHAEGWRAVSRRSRAATGGGRPPTGAGGGLRSLRRCDGFV